MNQSTIVPFALLTALFCYPSFAEEYGFVEFNVAPSPISNSKPQPVTFLGCNTMHNIDVDWGTGQQIFEIPFGDHQTESDQDYYVSKYYMASPPTPLTLSPTSKTNIGQLMPDRFTFETQLPKQVVDMDYSVLKPIYPGEIKADFDTEYPLLETPSCTTQDVDLVPINIECDNFPWDDGAMGASGIGFLRNNSDGDKIFIAKLGEAKDTALNCTATILDDIVLNHEVFFYDDQNMYSGLSKTINMTELYQDDQPMQFVCMERPFDDIPTGCLP